jgi:hypothetical protein
MFGFYFDCPMQPAFAILCQPQHRADDHVVLQTCVACSRVHVLNSLTGRPTCRTARPVPVALAPAQRRAARG